MTSEAELLAAILADPDDDAARAVYGDVLTARGDPRGELISVQLRLAELADDDPAWQPLARRQQELCTEHEATWLGGLGDGVDGRLTRGFVDRLRGTGDKLLAVALAIVGREPVDRIAVERVAADDVVRLAAGPALRRVRALELRSPLTFRPSLVLSPLLGPVARSPNLASVEELDLHGAAIDDAGVADLIDSPLADRLRRLDVGGGHVGTGVLARLLGGGLPRLAWLGLARMNLSGLAMHRLVASPGLQTVRGLDLSHCEIHGDAAAVLTAALPPLVELRLRGNRLRSEGCVALARAPALRGLRRLDISDNPLEAGSAAQLTAGFPELAWLTASAREKELTRLAAGDWPRLRTVELGGRHAGAGLRHLDAARWPGLRHLHILATLIDAAAIDALADGPAFRALTVLRVFSEDLDDAGVQRLAAAEWPTLHTLDLRGNKQLSDAGAVALAASRGLPAWLARLDARDTRIGERGLAALRERFGAAVWPPPSPTR